jgi:hypothetical protein
MRYHRLMSASGKTLQKMRRNQAGWRIDDLISVAGSNGIEWRRPGRGGSHVIFSADGIRGIVSVPDKRPIKPIYVRNFIALIDAVQDAAKETQAKRSRTDERKDYKPKP